MKERWSRLGWHGVAQIQHLDTHTHPKYATKHKQENSPRFAQMGYYSDLRLYSMGSSTLTVVSGQPKATTGPCLENSRDSIITHHRHQGFLTSLENKRGTFLICFIHSPKTFEPIR